MTGTASKLMFTSSTGQSRTRKAKPRRVFPVTVTQGPVPSAPAKPQLSRSTAEALYRSGGLMPSKNRLR